MSQKGHTGATHTVHHVTPLGVYTKVFLCLVALTILTVATSYMNFGELNIVIAMAIACCKALLVILFFMGMKYEGQENNVTFFCTFVFLAIFIGLTSSDLFYRKEVTPVHVDEAEAAQSAAPVDVQKYKEPTPEVVAKGKAVFVANCVTCHGSEGKGNGPAGAALTPHPRNFTSDQGWKFGRGLSTVFHTVSTGSPGTAMPAFTALGAEDRLAVAHYVRTFMSNAPAITEADIAALTKDVGTPAKPHLSIDSALEKVSNEWEAAHPGAHE